MRRILKHQYFSIYGTSIKSISFYKKTKYAFDKPFFDFLYLTEFILKILLLRARFFLKLIDTIKFINKKGIAVNGKLQTYINFSVKPNSLIQKCRKFPIYRPTFKKKK